MGVFETIVENIMENGRAVSVEINGEKLSAVEYGSYYAVMMPDGVKIFDGEHLIDSDFRVYDVHLKQFILYDFPVKKLLRDFGIDDMVPEPFIGVPAWVGALLIVLLLVRLVFLSMLVYDLYTGKSVYYALVVIGGTGVVRNVVETVYLKRANLFDLVVSAGILLFGLVFVL